MNRILVLLFSVLGIIQAQAQPSPQQLPLKLVYFSDFAPYSWVDESGQLRGILIDVAEEILSKRLGLKVSHEGMPWARAQKLVELGEADAFISTPTPDRLVYNQASKEDAITSYNSIYTTKDHPRMAELKLISKIGDELKGYRLVDYLGNGWGDKNLAAYERYKTPNLEAVFRVIASGRGDIFIGGSVISNYTLKLMGLTGQIVGLPNVLDLVPFNLCVGKKSSHLSVLGAWDRKILAMRQDGTLKKIYDQYR